VLPAEPRQRIAESFPRLEILDGVSPDALRRAQVIYTSKAAFDLAAAPSLRWVQLDVTAINHFRDQEITRCDIPVANVRGAYTVPTAELAIALLLALTRRFGPVHELQINRQWPTDYPALRGEDCYGKCLGIVGYGSIGRHVARIAKALGMQVRAAKRRPEIRAGNGFQLPETGDPEGLIPVAWYGMRQIHEMLPLCDAIVVTVPLTDESHGLIGMRELRELPAGAYLVNVGRGNTVDEEALIECLRSGHLAAAGLDVFAAEPLDAGSPLWSLPNVFITPHLGSYTQRQRHFAAEVLIENLTRFFSGRPLINLVDFKLGY
jgi:phosphoglycerate dehydrogenase-like enzyme